LPLIHRQTFEAAPEDVLKCAMAAVATQHLDNREDRTRGNQLHEFAWQEVKRVSDEPLIRNPPPSIAQADKHRSRNTHRSPNGASRQCRPSSCASILRASEAARPSHDLRSRSSLCIRG
jgi:hypothetical protein